MSKATLFLILAIVLIGLVAGAVALISWLWQEVGSLGGVSFLGHIFGVAHILFLLIFGTLGVVGVLIITNIWMNRRIWRKRKGEWSWDTTVINVVILLALAIGLNKLWSLVTIGWDKFQTVLGNGWVEFAFVCALLIGLGVTRDTKKLRRPK